MQKVFENVIEMLGRKRAYYNAKFESTQNLHEKDEATTRFEDFNEAIEIVKKAAEECKHGHFGCNTNGQHEKCSTCCDYDCKNRNREWFGVKDEEKKQTNADEIRSMSDEELAEFIEQISTDSMDTISFGTKDYEEIWEHKETALKWLQSEVEVDNFD